MEKNVRFPGGEKSVESRHVSGCHGFFGPEFCALSPCRKSVFVAQMAVQDSQVGVYCNALSISRSAQKSRDYLRL